MYNSRHSIHRDLELDIPRLVESMFDMCIETGEEEVDRDLNNIPVSEGGLPVYPGSPTPTAWSNTGLGGVETNSDYVEGEDASTEASAEEDGGPQPELGADGELSPLYGHAAYS